MNTLKKNSDFKRVYSRGKSKATPNLVLYWLPSEHKGLRVGFSISKKVGKAVVRNKLKRRLKELIRAKEVNNINKGYDLIIIARKPVVNLNFMELKSDLIKLLKKAGIWAREV